MYDLIVIGGGPAGYLASERAAKKGMKVIIFEKKSLGGTCLNVGCIPSKTLLNSAKIYEQAKNGSVKYGVHVGNIKINHEEVIKRKNKVVKTLVGGVEKTLKKLNVTVVQEVAVLDGKDGNSLIVKAAGQTYVGKNLIIATGSSASIPPIEGLKDSLETGFALTNVNIFDLKEIPKKLVVIGGGVIGMEMASYFKIVGSEVTIIEMLNTVGGSLDEEIADILKKSYEKKGVNLKLGCKVIAVKDSKVKYMCGDREDSIEADRVLISIGRKANTEGIGLETIGLYLERGNIVVNEKMETNVAGVYAPGDVNGKITLAHVAYREAEVAVNNIIGETDSMSYNCVPSIIYTCPEIASIGETEKSAKEKGFKVKTIKLPMQYSGRYVAENEDGEGICKIVYDEKNDRLLGAQIVANGSSEFIYGIGVFIDMQIPVNRLQKFIFPHPTIGEIIREALFEL